MKPFQSQKYKAVEWPEREQSKEILNIIRQGYTDNETDKAKLMIDERCGINHVNRKLRDLYSKGAKTLHMASYIISSIEDMSYKYPDIKLLLAALPSDNSPSACVSELGMLLADLNEHVIERIEVAMLSSHELFNDKYLNDPLQEYVETFE